MHIGLILPILHYYTAYKCLRYHLRCDDVGTLHTVIWVMHRDAATIERNITCNVVRNEMYAFFSPIWVDVNYFNTTNAQYKPLDIEKL